MQALLLVLLGVFVAAQAGAATLTMVGTKGVAKEYTTEALLARPDVETIEIAKDAAYGGDATYRGIRLSLMLAGEAMDGADILVVTATDGFVAQLPLATVLNDRSAGAIAYLAVEDPTKPWPKLKGKDLTAGPFYIVWSNPERSAIPLQAWPYRIARLEMKESVEKRYPAMVVADGDVPVDVEIGGQALPALSL
ncbi:MAG: hypothetical protein FJX60_22480 [Alphaproteobacteria bacterium]|nr:hypothetical protein [Alphaproteobacteria bacterium]